MRRCIRHACRSDTRRPCTAAMMVSAWGKLNGLGLPDLRQVLQNFFFATVGTFGLDRRKL
jgi:hypothetical protein